MPTHLTLFAYLNIANPMVAWEVAIGRVRSNSDRPRDGFGVSVWAYSLLRRYAAKGLDQRFRNELLLESVRQGSCPDACSRLEDLYFFESEYDAHAALERWGLSKRRNLISAVNFTADRLTKVDSEWITSYLSSEEREWMPQYWQGKTLGVKPLTEVLGRGIGLVQNRALRIQAYQSIIERWPTSTPLLSMACCAFAEYGLEDIAIVRPAITSLESGVQGSHSIDLGDLKLHEDRVIAALDSCKQRGEVPPMIVPDDGESFFKLPDLTSMDFTLADKVCSQTLSRIHDAGLES
jgi:hypothetical protein